MQTYPLKLNPSAKSVIVHADADLFVYESGDPGAGDAHISVRPENGAEIILKPGQRFRIKGTAARWNVALVDPGTTLSGSIVIGSGEFDDANTLNVMKLDASFANSVTVTNDAAHAVPVAVQGTASVTGNVAIPAGVKLTNTTAERVPVSLDVSQTMNVLGNIIAYQSGWNGSGLASPANTPLTIVAPAANVNGIMVNKSTMQYSGTNYGTALVAKASAPTGLFDGDIIAFVNSGVQQDENQYKIPPGKGLYWVSDSAHVAGSRIQNVLYTVL